MRSWRCNYFKHLIFQTDRWFKKNNNNTLIPAKVRFVSVIDLYFYFFLYKKFLDEKCWKCPTPGVHRWDCSRDIIWWCFRGNSAVSSTSWSGVLAVRVCVPPWEKEKVWKLCFFFFLKSGNQVSLSSAEYSCKVLESAWIGPDMSEDVWVSDEWKMM